MSLPEQFRNRFIGYLEEPGHRQFSFFTKTLYAFFLVKLIVLWGVLDQIVEFYPPELNSLQANVLFAPVHLACINPDVFILGTCFLIVIGLVSRLNFFYSSLIFWLSISVSRLALPVTNGSDQVLNLFLFLSIGNSLPGFLLPRDSVRTIISNFTFLLCRVQLALIYFISGFDKLISHAWRSGDAVHSIVNLDFFINPVLMLPVNKPLFAAIAWCAILFELFFALLIWFRKFRMTLLFIGVIFHLGIIYFLSLPDFGVLMTLSYILFLPGELFKPKISIGLIN